jgi:hypothetical protein
MKRLKLVLCIFAALFTLGWLVRLIATTPGLMRRVAATTEGEIGFIISHFAINLIVITIGALITYALWSSVRRNGMVKQ